MMGLLIWENKNTMGIYIPAARVLSVALDQGSVPDSTPHPPPPTPPDPSYADTRLELELGRDGVPVPAVLNDTIFALGCTYNVSIAADAPISTAPPVFCTEEVESPEGRVDERCKGVDAGLAARELDE